MFAVTTRGISRSTDRGATWTLVHAGEQFYSLATLGSAVFIGGVDGLWRSLNSGGYWTRSTVGLPAGAYVGSLGVRGGVVYATVQDHVYRSSDRGATWTLANDGLPGPAWLLQVSPPGVELYASTLSTIYRAVDGPPYWEPLASQPVGTYARGVARVGARLFMGFEDGGMSVSSDEGASWTRINDGLPEAYVFSVTGFDGDVYAATRAGIYRSSNGDSPWTPINSGLGGLFEFHGFSTLGTSLYVGTWGLGVMRLDAGTKWSMVGPSETDVHDLTRIAGRVFAVSRSGFGGMFFSDDRGRTWENENAARVYVFSLGVQGTHLLRSVMGSDGHHFVQRSNDGGKSWQSATLDLPGGYGIEEFAATDDCVLARASNTLYRSLDHGATWTVVSNPGGTTWPRAIAAGGGRLLVAAASSSSEGSLYYSDDDGTTWTRALNGPPYISALAARSSIVLAVTHEGAFRSTDGGITWLGPEYIGSESVYVIDMYSDHAAIVDNSGQVWVSSDAGVKWTAVPKVAGLDFYTVAAGDAEYYAGTSSGVWRWAY